ncbi:phosphate ABC transporter permease subunit PstC [Aurantivibrio plasticivorans]
MAYLINQSINRLDRGAFFALGLISLICCSLLGMVIWFLFHESLPVLRGSHAGSFIFDDSWFPLEQRFGVMPMVWASLAIALGATFIATPFGIASAIFLAFYSRGPIKSTFRLLMNILAGVPSVVLGLWGLTELVPIVASIQPPGTSLLTAVLVLSLMILPTVTLTSTAALSAVPPQFLEGAQALGFNQKSVILHIALPAAKAGIISGVLLAIARALGETMVVLMVAGNVVQNPSGLLEPVRALTANIALEMAYAMEDHRASLFFSGLLLTLVVWALAMLSTRFRSLDGRTQ